LSASKSAQVLVIVAVTNDLHPIDLTLVPEAGAECVSSARSDLCGGRPESTIMATKGRPYRDRKKLLSLRHTLLVRHLDLQRPADAVDSFRYAASVRDIRVRHK
jgi:hypothetical protein